MITPPPPPPSKFAFLSRISISQRLLAVALIVSVGLALLAAYAWTSLTHVKDLARRTEQVRVQQLAQAAAMELNVTRISLQLRHAMLARNERERQEAVEDIQAKRRLIEETLRAYEASLFTPQGKALFAKLPPAFENFWRVGHENLQLILQGQRESAFAYLVDHTIPARNQVLSALAETVDYQRKRLVTDIAEMNAHVDRTLRAILLLVVMCAVLLFLAVFYIERLLQQRIRMTKTVAEQVRGGDLSRSQSRWLQDEFGPLVQAMEDMRERLRQVVSEVRQGAQSVEQSSQHVADDNAAIAGLMQDLSVSLQATSKASEQLALKVQQNFDHARQATALAHDAASVAQRGGEVVGDVVKTMEEIHASSQRIKEIIAVIEGIAFQTNILALNASVEAARAGEQGRGFAVVAGEVRALAQRSSQAAHEIKRLIGASAERVTAGSELVAKAGATMQEIVQAIGRVNAMVHEVDAASADQRRSLQEVQAAIRAMEASITQTADRVHKLSVSAAQLGQTSQALVSSVAYFRDDETSANVSAARHRSAHALPLSTGLRSR
ncbi:Methyl-accepting chemotaxis protein IV [Tepidimonas alkaliphilus]|uniref:Methyl-accepting chemotaxis protein IV n=1 Tax=Tepidimonas alkaliphilus TaxID=2588942 RepID=A0A554W784_9BURK|nr:methyl-accepting chemotaxis protein [Tepidimonas alkaliphilus]TSE19429.1 Methyl-accepting chemotaxis protein IV [Tepidimonas alkaliphilus]